MTSNIIKCTFIPFPGLLIKKGHQTTGLCFQQLSNEKKSSDIQLHTSIPRITRANLNSSLQIQLMQDFEMNPLLARKNPLLTDNLIGQPYWTTLLDNLIGQHCQKKCWDGLDFRAIIWPYRLYILMKYRKNTFVILFLKIKLCVSKILIKSCKF